MTAAEPADGRLSEDLTARVLSVDGVDRVFPPTVAAAAARAARRVVARDADDAGPADRVDVADDDGALVVTARIATRRDAETPATARRVADSLVESLPPDRDAVVRIRIARIG